MQAQLKRPIKSASRVTFKSLVVGLILIPINAYWINYTEMVWWAQFPTTMSLFFNVVFCLFILIGFNSLVKRYLPQLVLGQGELLTIYAMLCMSTAVASHDHVQVLAPMVGHAFWYDSPENEWKELFWQYLPSWLTVRDKELLAGFYKGESSFLQMPIIKVWLKPILCWSAFIFALLFVMICLNVLIRRQWTERERLAYPIIQLPLEMTREGGADFFKNRLFWIAFGVVIFIDIINGLNYFYPKVPLIGIRSRNIGYLFTEKPWNAIGWTPFSVYPFVIGLGFFMPLDLSFSCWFFFFFRKAQRVLGAIWGIRSLPGFPYDRQQSLGGYLGLSLFAIWASRHYLKSVLSCATFRRSKSEKMDDSSEPMRYRTALMGLVIGLGFLIFFCHRLGMSIWVAILCFGIYYTLSIGITRMRVESGAPAHDLHFMGPDYFVPAALGIRRLGPANLSALTWLFFFNRAHRSHPMPHQLEAFKLAERVGMRYKPLMIAMIIAIPIGALSAFWTYLYQAYHFGTGGGFAIQPFNRLQQWLTVPSSPDYPAVTFVGLGMLFAFFLMTMRMKFFWWPFHAVGYAVSGADDWCMNWLWASLIISTTAKWAILRHGGVGSHRKAIPFFLGLVLGEFTIGSLWSIFGLTFGTRTFMFKDW